MSRKLAGILVADAVAYSARMEENEAKALAALSNSRAIIDGILAEHQGSIIATAADSVIAEFPSALDAV
ncbi:MAG: adenylate/guanylate cyclase domain-containing protein, partial [Roseobacter sp.]